VVENPARVEIWDAEILPNNHETIHFPERDNPGLIHEVSVKLVESFPEAGRVIALPVALAKLGNGRLIGKPEGVGPGLAGGAGLSQRNGVMPSAGYSAIQNSTS
jgi:hypothetical protein